MRQSVPCVTMGLRLSRSGGSTAYIFLNYLESDLTAIMRQNMVDSTDLFFLLDSGGNMLLQSGESETLDFSAGPLSLTPNAEQAQGTASIRETESGERILCIRSDVKPLYYCLNISNDFWLFLAGSLLRGSLLTLLFASIVALCASWALARCAYKPIEMLMRCVKNPNASSYGANIDEETGYLLMHFLLAGRKTEDLEREKLRQYTALRKAQANILQAQITPHFLYNTLQSIQIMVMLETGNTQSGAAKCILALAEMMHALLQRGRDIISLGEELDFVQQFLFIKSHSYPDLQVDFQIPEELKGVEVPKLCLQPLVENALAHGMRDGRTFKITIGGAMQNERLILSVSDNGLGMPQAEIDRINHALQEEVLLRDQHVGLMNLMQRLKLLYGKQASLSLANQADGGLKVSFTLCPNALWETGCPPPPGKSAP